MCRIGEGLKSGKLPAVLYTDNKPASKKMERLLDSAGVRYERADAGKESISAPVLVVNGTFLDAEGVKEVLRSV